MMALGFSLGVSDGGLGARSAVEHALAACVASFSACRDLCGLLWADFDPLDLDDGCRLSAAESSLRSVIPSGANIRAESASPSQKFLSGRIEALSVSRIFADPALPRHRRLHLNACRVPGASPTVADAFHEAESRNCAFQGTAASVAERGATFVKLVLEACGVGWSQAFRAVVTWIASESRTACGLSTDLPRDTSLRIAQRISCTLHRENARAILRRSPGSVNGGTGFVCDQVPSSGW